MKTAVRKQVNALDIDTPTSTTWRSCSKTNPPKPQDAEIVARMARIGIVPGQDFDGSKLGALDREAIRAVPKLALAKMGAAPQTAEDDQRLALLHLRRRQLRHRLPDPRHGQPARVRAGTGRRTRSTRCRRRTPTATTTTAPSTGTSVRFEKGQLPPVDAFWSLTLYDTDFFFVPNPIDRYEVSQRDTFVTNADGSIELYIQAESPGKDKEANWLPAPKGKFALVLRMYGPKQSSPSIVDGIVDAAAGEARCSDSPSPHEEPRCVSETDASSVCSSDSSSTAKGAFE